MKGIIVLASSRSAGNTYKCVELLKEHTGFEIMDLKQKKIGPYDYEYLTKDDDFKACFDRIIEDKELVIFATPVYWYTMSGILKNFIDRFSDCIRIYKDDGRKLRGMKMAMLSCSTDDDRPTHFSEPFTLSASYLGMDYIGDIHCFMNEDILDSESRKRIKKFAARMK